MKFSEQYDNKGIKNIGTITFGERITADNKYPSKLSYRSTWQKYRDGKRYRIIPKRTDEWPRSSKIAWPTLYLGLSRLYPLGESVTVKGITPTCNLTEEETRSIIEDMQSILNITDESHDVTVASISETSKKRGVGLNTQNYNYLANSAGQDNLGQILMSVLSFKRLKTRLGADWYGGILLIDELDATLHPLSQNKLLDFLYHQAEELGVQIVFTTHSLGLLDHICTMTDHNDPNAINGCEVVSLTKSNGPVEIDQNPSSDFIYKQLMATYRDPHYRKKISIFSEDSEARYFISKLLEKYAYRFKLLEISLGNNQLLRLLVQDYINFSQYIYILDGDSEEEINKITEGLKPNQLKCVLKLPGDKSPERVIWEYLAQLPPGHKLFTGLCRQMGYSKMSIRESGPLSSNYSSIEKEKAKYKRWFNDNIPLIELVIDYWREDNMQAIEEFISNFRKAYNWVAQGCGIPIMRPEQEIDEVEMCQQHSLL